MLKELPLIPENKIGPVSKLDAFEPAREKRRKTPESAAQLIDSYFSGNAHTHTHLSTEHRSEFESSLSLAEEVEWSKKTGLNFLVATEHSSDPGNPKKLEPSDPISLSLLKQAGEIAEINRRTEKEGSKDFMVFSGVEASLLYDQENKRPILDMPEIVLKNLDLVIASRHSIGREKELTAIEETLKAAIQHPQTDVIGHPDRNIKIEHNWDIFRKNFPEAEALHQERNSLQKQADQSTDLQKKEGLQKQADAMNSLIRLTIGKQRPGDEEYADKRTNRWQDEFQKIENSYWQMWDRLLLLMAKEGKAFEINLNSPPSQELVRRAAQLPNLKFFLSFDAHDINQFKTDKELKEFHKKWGRKEKLTEAELVSFKTYKEEGLSKGPGSEALLKLAHWIKHIKDLGLGPERIINSSQLNLLTFLLDSRNKETENLKFLKKSITI